MTIYKITNLINNKSYIGQTRMPNPYKRINFHFKNNKPKSKSLIWEAIKKFGKENFKIEILCETDNIFTLNKQEQDLIKDHNTLIPNGYNIQGGGQLNKFTEETKRKISESLKGHCFNKGIKKTKEHRESMSKSRKGFTSLARINAAKLSAVKRQKTVKCTNINTLEVRIFNSIQDASMLLNVQGCNISRVCNNKQGRKQANGYKFEFI